MIGFDEAIARLLGSALPLGPERVPLDRALGRVLAEDIAANAAMPAFDYSAMDGYAVAARDFTGQGPFELPVVGTSSAGGVAPALAPKTACRIFTGAELPKGADAIVMQERVDRRGDVAVFASAPSAGDFVRKRGADLQEGATALKRGMRLSPGRIALAAALDRPELVVARRPVVVVLASGDELRSPGQAARPGSIVESNAPFVAATARQAGAIVRVLPFVRDDAEAARIAVAEALRGADVLVTTGGVSVGDHDVIKPALEAAGVTLDFWKVRIKPGKPIVVGRTGSTHVLGLPGNPASASLTFLLFGVPLLRALQGDAAPLPRRFEATLDRAIAREAGRMEFLRAELGDGGTVRVLVNQASGAVTSFAQADVLVVVPEDRANVALGERLEALRIAEI